MPRARGANDAQQTHQTQQLPNPQSAQQPGQPFPPQVGTQPPPAPKKNFFARHKIFSGLLVVVVLIVVTQAVSGGDKPATTPAPGTSTAAPEAEGVEGADGVEGTEATQPAEVPAAPVTAGIGSAVADGKFEFTVTSLEPGVGQIGDSTFGVAAQGQFLLVHVTVTNVGDEAQYFDSSSQKLLDGQGRTHSADSTAAIYLPDSNSFLTSINPGNTVEGVVVFDIPADATPASIELHDSPFSGGVTVALS